MDSWFTMPATVASLAGEFPVIGMVKKIRTVHYRFQGHSLDLMAIYRRLKKRRGRAKILASTIVTLSSGLPCKLVFVRDRNNGDWLAILSTDTDLPDQEIVRIYGKCWDIEVFFKMVKQHLRLAKEIQCRDFDALIGHTSIVFMRYMLRGLKNGLDFRFYDFRRNFQKIQPRTQGQERPKDRYASVLSGSENPIFGALPGFSISGRTYAPLYGGHFENF